MDRSSATVRPTVRLRPSRRRLRRLVCRACDLSLRELPKRPVDDLFGFFRAFLRAVHASENKDDPAVPLFCGPDKPVACLGGMACF